MARACRILLGAVCLLLTGCGTYVPDIQEFWGTPDDTGRAVAMLARGDLPYSTGQVIMVDGGLTLPRL